jgi:hypothetical protein
MDRTFDRAIPLPPGRRAWLQRAGIRLRDGMIPPRQDNATKYCLMSEGLAGVFPVVNRAVNIGDTGLHTSPKNFRKRKLSAMRIYDFPDDQDIHDFEMKG